MDGIRAWILSICFASVAAGIMQYIAPSNSRNSVIKLVLTLYILVAAFAPIQALRYPDTRIALPEVTRQASTLDSDALIEAQAKANIEAELAQICKDAGYDAAITVQMDGYEVISAYTDSEAAAPLIQQQLGGSIPVYIGGEGQSSG